MSAHITRLDVVRAQRAPPAEVIEAAERYVALAEEAMAMVFTTEKSEARRAVCRITEAWLALAEAELER